VSQPLLSIVIATRNRVPYCIESIRTVLGITGEALELVIQDNSDNEELKRLVTGMPDPRLVYNYTPPPFSMIDNFNLAISLAKGTYVCLIGDDDSVCRQIVDVASWAKQNNIDSVCPTVFNEYIWPEAFGDQRDSTLMIPGSNPNIKEKDSSAALHEFFRGGALDYLKKGFPKLYHGIVKRSCLEEIKARTGNYIGGLSPDIYSAVALSCVVRSHILLGIPVTIAGACKASATIASMNGRHSGELKNAPHFRDMKEYSWDKNIPYVYSVETIWAETAMKAAADMKRQDLIDEFNSNMFIARNILRNTGMLRYFAGQTWKHLRNNGKPYLAIWVALIMGFHLVKFVSRFAAGIFIKPEENKSLVFKDVGSLQEAVSIATGNLEERSMVKNLPV
jgi:glycosyltransferase involved in cell wall biosynthesis